MAEPAAPRQRAPAVRETHISWILLTPDRAYKVLKPVRMPFVDLADRTVRLAAAQRELELNRRLAPDVYLGLADIHEEDQLVDRMIVMRRLPDERRLAALVRDETFSDCLRAVARRIAAFHAGLPPVDPAPTATAEAVAGNWEDNVATIGQHVGSVIDAAAFERVADLARTYLSGRGRLFQERIANGMVRDGHGDLLADDIFCLDDGPRIIDCLAFSDDYRIGDVLLDVAFLVMDIDRLAGWDHARQLMADYQEFSSEHHPPSLAHHYVAYRAHVRTKVLCLRHAQGDETSAALARDHHRLALEHLERARIRLVVVGGGPGAGKTTLANALADRYSCGVLSTDEIRKALTGTPRPARPTAAPQAGIYDDSTTDATYAQQLREAQLLLTRGQSVVLDASWTRERHRRAAAKLARDTAAELVEINCVLDTRTAKERIARRRNDPHNASDATAEIVDHLQGIRDPWPSATTIDTSASPESVVDRAVAAIEAQRPV